MKKLTALFLALILCISFVGCSKDSGDIEKKSKYDRVIELLSEGKYNKVLSDFEEHEEYFEKVSLDEKPETVKKVYKAPEEFGYIAFLETTSQFSSEEMEIAVSFSLDGEITGIVLTDYFDSKDLGEDYVESFIGQNSSLSGVDLLAGVTFSSEAFRDAVADGFDALISGGLIG